MLVDKFAGFLSLFVGQVQFVRDFVSREPVGLVRLAADLRETYSLSLVKNRGDILNRLLSRLLVLPRYFLPYLQAFFRIQLWRRVDIDVFQVLLQLIDKCFGLGFLVVRHLQFGLNRFQFNKPGVPCVDDDNRFVLAVDWPAESPSSTRVREAAGRSRNLGEYAFEAPRERHDRDNETYDEIEHTHTNILVLIWA